MMQQPGASLPKQAGCWRDLKAAYRLLSHPGVDPHAIQGPHRALTHAACADHRVVLCVQDTTGLDFSHRKAMTGLGKIGDGGG
ncbi:transposase DNA-binding-containing protein, partial [Arthrospira platensis SPKY1]|nr:transposase DNA-binding-containing protein [Arthrospira platensis SPKY1]